MIDLPFGLRNVHRTHHQPLHGHIPHSSRHAFLSQCPPCAIRAPALPLQCWAVGCKGNQSATQPNHYASAHCTPISTRLDRHCTSTHLPSPVPAYVAPGPPMPAAGWTPPPAAFPPRRAADQIQPAMSMSPPAGRPSRSVPLPAVQRPVNENDRNFPARWYGSAEHGMLRAFE